MTRPPLAEALTRLGILKGDPTSERARWARRWGDRWGDALATTEPLHLLELAAALSARGALARPLLVAVLVRVARTAVDALPRDRMHLSLALDACEGWCVAPVDHLLGPTVHRVVRDLAAADQRRDVYERVCGYLAEPRTPPRTLDGVARWATRAVVRRYTLDAYDDAAWRAAVTRAVTGAVQAAVILDPGPDAIIAPGVFLARCAREAFTATDHAHDLGVNRGARSQTPAWALGDIVRKGLAIPVERALEEAVRDEGGAS